MSTAAPSGQSSLQTADKRMRNIDGAKGFVILLMLAGHAFPPAVPYKLIYGFHMPFFFLLSGYLYHKEKWEQAGFLTFCKKRFTDYMAPYFVYALCNLVLNIPVEIHNGIAGKALLHSTLNHCFWIAYGAGNKNMLPNCTPLWFLPCLFFAGLLLFCLQKLRKSWLRVGVCVIFVLTAYLISVLHLPKFPWHTDTALIAAVYMQLGLWAKQFRLPDKRLPAPACVVLVIGSAALGVFCILQNKLVDLNFMRLQNIALTLIGSICVSIAVFLVFFKLYRRGRFLAWLGRNTMPLFAFNFVVNAYIQWIWSTLFPSAKLSWHLLFLLGLPCLIALIPLHNAIRKMLRSLISCRRAVRRHGT